MLFYKLLIFSCLFCTVANATDFLLGLGVEADSTDGRAISTFADIEYSDKTWLSLVAVQSETDGVTSSNETTFLSVNVDSFFDPVGLRIGAGYWGNSNVLDSQDLSMSLYINGNSGSLSIDFERRKFEFLLQAEALSRQPVEFSADGLGISSRLAFSQNIIFYLGGMAYDYSKDLRVLPNINSLAYISRSRLSAVGNLIEHQLSAGLEYRFGLKSVDFAISQWQIAIDDSRVDSYSIGYLTPVFDRFDTELRLSLDQSETYGKTTAVSFYLYYFGGS